MRRYRKGQIFRPPTAAESAANADATEGFRRRSSGPQHRLARGDKIFVKTHEDGIPARDGTTIYSAICTRLVETSTAEEKIILETDEELEVFNLETTDVAGDIYAQTGLTLHGTRCVEMGSGGGTATIRFEVTAAGPFYSETSSECNTVTADVLDVSCGASGVAVDDEVTIWDPSRCWFSLPIENLEYAHGTAIQMARGGSFAISDCLVDVDDDSEGCFWMVLNLCCLEEVAGY